MPADAIFEWQRAPKGAKKPKYEIIVPGRESFGMAGVWKLWKNPKTDYSESVVVASCFNVIYYHIEDGPAAQQIGCAQTTA